MCGATQLQPLHSPHIHVLGLHLVCGVRVCVLVRSVIKGFLDERTLEKIKVRGCGSVPHCVWHT